MKKVILSVLTLCSISAFAEVNLAACKGCHGQNFEKKALGKSLIVKDMTKKEVSDSLVGYKNGTYGAAMKGVMVGQVVKYSEKELRNTGLGMDDKK